MRHAAARAALTDPALSVPSPAPADSGMAWVRTHVARFCDGEPHTRRRALADHQLSTTDTKAMRAEATQRTKAALATSPIDLMPIARTVPGQVLAAALDLPPWPAETHAAIATAYLTGNSDAVADAAVDALRTIGPADETLAARIALLAQAVDATAGLIGNATFALLHDHADQSSEQVIAETMRHNPPVRATRRLDAAGEVHVIDLADGDEPLGFGFGPHACPGRQHAVALAAGVLDAVRGLRLVSPELDYPSSPNLRVPRALVVTTSA